MKHQKMGFTRKHQSDKVTEYGWYNYRQDSKLVYIKHDFLLKENVNFFIFIYL